MEVESYTSVHQPGLHGAGAAALRRRHRGRAACALPGGLDDRRAQACARWRSSRRSRAPRAGPMPGRSAGSPATAGPISGW
nr:hypothetical protein [Nocardioides convexus]